MNTKLEDPTTIVADHNIQGKFQIGDQIEVPYPTSEDRFKMIITNVHPTMMTIARMTWWRRLWYRAVAVVIRFKCRIGAHEMLGECDIINGQFIKGKKMHCKYCNYERWNTNG